MGDTDNYITKMHNPYGFVYIYTGAQQLDSRSFLTEKGDKITIDEGLLPSGFASHLIMFVDPMVIGNRSIRFLNR